MFAGGPDWLELVVVLDDVVVLDAALASAAPPTAAAPTVATVTRVDRMFRMCPPVD
jgi:hypothetical protein